MKFLEKGAKLITPSVAQQEIKSSGKLSNVILEEGNESEHEGSDSEGETIFDDSLLNAAFIENFFVTVKKRKAVVPIEELSPNTESSKSINKNRDSKKSKLKPKTLALSKKMPCDFAYNSQYWLSDFEVEDLLTEVVNELDFENCAQYLVSLSFFASSLLLDNNHLNFTAAFNRAKDCYSEQMFLNYFILLNTGNHWLCLIVCAGSKTLVLYDPKENYENKGTLSRICQRFVHTFGVNIDGFARHRFHTSLRQQSHDGVNCGLYVISFAYEFFCQVKSHRKLCKRLEVEDFWSLHQFLRPRLNPKGLVKILGEYFK